MNIKIFFEYLIVMAGVTYLIRMLPFTIFQGEIKNKYMKAFFAYIPYTVLGAMTFPAIIYSVGDLIPGIAGTILAFILSYYKKSLITVALASSAVALVLLFFQ